MSYKDMVTELDALLLHMEFGMKNLAVIQSAIAEEVTDPENGGDALYCVQMYLNDLLDQMVHLVDRAGKAELEDCA